ncbi:MAG: rhamnogalacturonan acetylesterase [Selenomonas sp.]|jgi:lysophospholipase L1-like esterase|nr:rhamnogalacturonan acetylesterase [Selenomonas sp.]MCI7330680.1 rhamnogalacturonan acetylesterase [Selenomonadaceae bacterium]MDY3917361.1 rhamnogalacturonan acetylesterase [Selenomonadaceae bacterium]
MQKRPLYIFMAGDSTMAAYNGFQAPMSGWGQQLERYFDTQRVRVSDQAICGRSAQSFIEEGRLAWLLKGIRPGDYLLIQFAHNDEKLPYEHPAEEFQRYLREYIDGARQHGANPVLVTPVERRRFDEAGRLEMTHAPFVEAMKALTLQEQVPLLDLNAATRKLYEELGPEKAKELFCNLAPGEHPNYPDGHEDDTHYCEVGAELVAGLFTTLLRQSKLELRNYLREEVGV